MALFTRVVALSADPGRINLVIECPYPTGAGPPRRPSYMVTTT